MRSPLAVRISDGLRDRHVTRFVKGLRFTKTAPGGHHSASVQFDLPDNVLGDLGPADRLFIYDGRNARTVWDGYVENPGRTAVLGGGRYDVSAMGGVVLANDNARPVVFRSTDLSGPQWKRHTGTHPDATVELDQSVIPGVDSIKALIPPKTSLTTGGTNAADTANTLLRSTGQRLHAATVTVRGGRVDANFYMGLIGITTAGFGVTHFEALTTADTVLMVAPAGSLDPGSSVILDLQHPGTTASVPEEAWAAFRDFVLVPTLVTATGSDASPSNLGYVMSSEVVAHIVGALLPQIDGSSAVIGATTHGIDNLAYLDGVRPQQILDDLTLYEPDFLWEILETAPSGKHRFAYRAWPTTPRYEISGREFTESGGELDLCNRIAVSWKDAAGAEQTTVRTASVPALGSRVRDAEPITLPDGQGSQANAERIGDEVLAALNTPTRSGTAVIRQPIHDTLTGHMAMPWEIEPGYVVRVRDIGVDLRMTEMTYDDSNCSASLTLGTPTLTQAQRLARLTRR